MFTSYTQEMTLVSIPYYTHQLYSKYIKNIHAHLTGALNLYQVVSSIYS